MCCVVLRFAVLQGKGGTMQGKSASLTPEKIEAAAALLVSGHTQTKAYMLPRMHNHMPREEDAVGLSVTGVTHSKARAQQRVHWHRYRL